MLTLPDVLDLSAAVPLRSLLLAHRGTALDIDASGVQRMGGLCLQVLLAAEAAWQADNLGFRILTPSPAFSDALCLTAATRLVVPMAACLAATE